LRGNKNLGVYKGALYENFVAEAFVKQGLGLFFMLWGTFCVDLI
jgi:hypothetical protein